MNIIQISQSTLRNDNCRLKIDIPENIEIFGEENKLDRVITNIIQNSADAYAENHKYGDINAAASVVDENCIIKISDEAGGIPDEIMETLFKESKTTKTTGTGIGLLGAYKMVVADFSGKLECETEKGKGTTFIITIPLNLEK